VDLRDIEAWGRELLEHEAAKRGVRSPEVYSRTELVRLILRHDYGAPTNMKQAARLIGGLLGSAKQALRKRLDAPLHGRGVKTHAGAARDARGRGAFEGGAARDAAGVSAERDGLQRDAVAGTSAAAAGSRSVGIRAPGDESARGADMRAPGDAKRALDRAETESKWSTASAAQDAERRGAEGASARVDADARAHASATAANDAALRGAEGPSARGDADTPADASATAAHDAERRGAERASARGDADTPADASATAAHDAALRGAEGASARGDADTPADASAGAADARRAELHHTNEGSSRERAAATRDQSSAPDDLEHSYVGERILELPGVSGAGESRPAARLGRSLMPRQHTAATESQVGPTEKSARERAEEDLERSHVTGLKLDLAAAAERDAVRAAFDAARADESAASEGQELLAFETHEAPGESAPAPAYRERLREEGDALRDAAQVREEAREARRESERVRADARAAGQHDADWVRPDAGWHKVSLTPPGADATRAEGEEVANSAMYPQPSAAVETAQPSAAASAAATAGEARPRPSDSGVHRAEEDSGVHRAAEGPELSERQVNVAPRDADATAQRSSAGDTGRELTAFSSTAREARDAAATPVQVPHLRLVEPLPEWTAAETAADEPATHGAREAAESGAIAPRDGESQQTTASSAAAAAGIEASEHLTYGPHPQDGMLLRWRVTPEAVERARKLLGSNGELAVRIVAVRVEPHAVVKTDVIDHGPIAEAGDWTAPLLPTDARYVSAVGLKSAGRFVSIVHAKL
jgi:trimeric autotransporter adhesin